MTGTSSHGRRYCCDLDDVISTEGEEAEIPVPLAGEEKGAARGSDFVVP